jgi:hypothetical protein
MRVKEKTPFPLRFSKFFSLIISAQCTKNTIPGTEKKNSRCNNNHDDDDDLQRQRRQLQHNSSKCEGGGAHTREEGSTKDDDVAQRCLALPSVSSKHPSCSFIHLHCYSSIREVRRGTSSFKARFTRREIVNATMTPTGKLKPEKK